MNVVFNTSKPNYHFM